MEYAHGGELFARLTGDKGAYKESEAKLIFSQIASAIEYMHDRNCIHRDLKAENVFFATAASDINVKVGDFGFATQVQQIDQHLNTFCGSPPYAAPELFQVLQIGSNFLSSHESNQEIKGTLRFSNS